MGLEQETEKKSREVEDIAVAMLIRTAARRLGLALVISGVNDRVRREIVDIAAKINKLYKWWLDIAELREGESGEIEKRHDERGRFIYIRRIIKFLNKVRWHFAKIKIIYEIMYLLCNSKIEDKYALSSIIFVMYILNNVDIMAETAKCGFLSAVERMAEFAEEPGVHKTS